MSNEYSGLLDALLDGVLLVTSVDPEVDLGRIDAFWSINNSWTPDGTTPAILIRPLKPG